MLHAPQTWFTSLTSSSIMVAARMSSFVGRGTWSNDTKLIEESNTVALTPSPPTTPNTPEKGL